MFYFQEVPNKATNLPCSFLSLSEFYENWEKISLSKEEERFLLPVNWELVHSLLTELKEEGKLDLELPSKEIPVQDPISLREWRFQIKQALLALLERDYRQLLEKYNTQVFIHPSSKLNYKLVHPEEIRHKTKPVPTISAMKNLHSFLNRRLDILPLFSNSKDANLKVYESWKIESLKGETSFKFDESLLKEWETNASDLFVLHSFKEPSLPKF
ncbi:hypothetical protein [Mycoplasma suis]|uniref:Uncharacterized protein n=2 Tax=Mycoplasma suis TaxID=57372 RepID=F0QR68_MYCSL|nr:hypothetical protein [Mycoplasma suis]ADX97988.1 hypothetical protein MSU_0452 [Mycoplasma suis str. Illinois]CBZ40485.1 hypothetical protein MSUIS_03920 [Mycoplasma suis KI3806]